MWKLLVALLVLISGYFVFNNPTLFVDETVHYPVTTSFCRLAPEIHPNLTNIPAYHATLGLTCYITSLVLPFESLSALRLLSFIYALPSLLFVYLIVKKLQPKLALSLTLLTLFLPIAYPFYFLVYTDIMALAAVLGAYYFYLRGSFAISGLFAAFSVAVRQNSIIWLIWIALLILIDEFSSDFRLNFKSIIRHLISYLKKSSVFILGAVAFAGFIIWNGGISLAKAEEWAHPSFSLRLGNVYLLLMLMTIFYWPFVFNRLNNLNKLVKNKWWLLSLTISALLISLTYFFGFENNHPYNQHTFSLHNLVLVESTSSLTSKVISLIPILIGLFILFINPLRSLASYLIYPFSLLFILPSWLIEPRYYILPYILFLLFKKPSSDKAMKAVIAWQIFLSLFILMGILRKWFFT